MFWIESPENIKFFLMKFSMFSNVSFTCEKNLNILTAKFDIEQFFALFFSSHSKLPYSTHPGYNPSIAVGDITLSFTHKPFQKVDPAERKKIVHDILYPSTDMFCTPEENMEV